jgi:hypothetical protein
MLMLTSELCKNAYIIHKYQYLSIIKLTNNYVFLQHVATWLIHLIQLKSYLKFFFILSTASITFPRWPKADRRKNPSLMGPKPEPGVPAALHSILRLSKREDFMFAPAETVLESTQKVNEALRKPCSRDDATTRRES